MKLMYILASALMFSMITSQDFDYEKAWKEVNHDIENGLPQDAFDKVNKIYSTAQAENNNLQRVKACAYMAEYTVASNEDGVEKANAIFLKELSLQKAPFLNILHSYYAGFLQNYLNINRYDIQQRTEVDDQDLRTMSMGVLQNKILHHLKASLQEEKSLFVPVEKFKPILNEFDNLGREARPELYDVLANRVLEFMSNESNRTVDPLHMFTINDKKFFAPVADFIKLDIPSEDTTSLKRQALLLLQNMLQNAQIRNNKALAAEINLERLSLILNDNNISDARMHYEAALEQGIKDYKGLKQQHLYQGALAASILTGSDANKYLKAKALCEQCLKENGEVDSFYNNGCKQTLQNITQKTIATQGEYVVPIGDAGKFNIRSRNIDHVYFKIVSMPAEVHKLWNNHEDAMKKLKNLTAVYQWDNVVKDGKDHNEVTTASSSPKLKKGVYLVLVSNKADFSEAFQVQSLQVTNLSYVAVNSNKETSFIILDRNSGKPIKGAKVDFIKEEYNYTNHQNNSTKIGSSISDKDGKVTAPSNAQQIKLEVTYKDDKFSPENSHYIYRNEHNEQPNVMSHIYTDRAIYRPGQVVYYKVVTMEQYKERVKVVPNETFFIQLMDANGTEVYNTKLKTNEFGSASGSFTLPQGRLTGDFYLQTPHGTTFINVEEYKRPTFEVKIDTVKKEYKLGDKVTMTGQALGYAGNGISNATVKYTVVKKESWPYYYRWCYPMYYNEQEAIIATGEVLADEAGKFKVDFITEESHINGHNPIYIYELKAEALDATGESHHASYALNISKKTKTLSENIPFVFDLDDKVKPIIAIKTINDVLLNEKGNFKIHKLKEPNEVEIPEDFGGNQGVSPYNIGVVNGLPHYAKWPIEKMAIQGAFESNKAIDIATLKYGVYKLEAIANTGVSDTLIKYFVITDIKGKKLPKAQQIYHHLNKKQYAVGDKMIIDFGAAADNQMVYMIFSRGNEVLDKKWIKLSPSTKYEYIIKNEDLGGLSVQYFFGNRNKFYTINEPISVPWTEKELKIEYENVRDKMAPGAESTWKIKVSGSRKDKWQAEVLAALYDASLDAFTDHIWNSSFYAQRYSGVNIEPVLYGISYLRELNYTWNVLYLEMKQRILPALILPYGGGYDKYNHTGGRMYKTSRAKNEEVMEESAPAAIQTAPAVPPPARADNLDAFKSKAVGDASASNVSNEGLKKEEPLPSPRTNLKETVFFFPHLTTDENGNITINFKMNEAMTKWRFMTLAHTKDMATGYNEQMVTTTKDVMIVANSPRFIRVGDELYFTARVSNLTDHSIKVFTKLSLKNAANDADKNSWIVGSNNADVSLNAGESKAVSWHLKTPNDGTSVLDYTVYAQSGNFTDAETASLPVLTNQTLVTETKAMYVRGKQNKVFEFLDLKKAANSTTHRPHSLTVEVSSSPVWYAVQAMPYVIEQNSECATQLADKYYVNSLASHIVNTHPQVEKVFKQWQATNSEALLSNLEKNQELKNALLEETPWVLEAVRENQQKANIIRIFDRNNVKADLAQTLNALEKLQLPNGAFTWYPGGRGDYYTTKYVLASLAKSKAILANEDAAEITDPAVNYVDTWLKEYFEKLKIDYKTSNQKIEDHVPSNEIVHHLFVRSGFKNLPYADGSQEAYIFFMKQAIKNWTKYGLYVQSLLGRVDYRAEGKVYKDIAKSIMQKSMKSDELGIYWNTGTGYQWHELPLEGHAAMLEFFTEINTEVATTDEMKLWLLKNKQVNRWHSPSASTAAISALLLTNGKSQTDLQFTKVVNTQVGSHILPNNHSLQAGTQYYKQSWSATEIKLEMSTIKMNNENENIAWGGAYYQYFEDIDKVQKSSTLAQKPLKITKEIYKEISTNAGKRLVKVDSKTVLHPGDLLVSRVIITADRDMEYLHLKDMRGSGMEPNATLSGYRWGAGFGYYESIRDMASHYYIDHLPKGIHVFESKQKVVHRGSYAGALATIQCFYAPEFGAVSNGERLMVE
jgi:uncharacterized protein YfaS (alpha-2-macroglobulin family)